MLLRHTVPSFAREMMWRAMAIPTDSRSSACSEWSGNGVNDMRCCMYSGGFPWTSRSLIGSNTTSARTTTASLSCAFMAAPLLHALRHGYERHVVGANQQRLVCSCERRLHLVVFGCLASLAFVCRPSAVKRRRRRGFHSGLSAANSRHCCLGGLGVSLPSAVR
ncbi:hypothetical protein KC321_g43 [Hortaea werneckii]|nr:hypothetical protein KC321_g43 [Hortaea werneckii]